MRTYVPLLRWKRGERVGVSHVSALGRRDVRPLFILGTAQYVGKDATKKRAAIPAADIVCQDLLTTWGTAPFYLDAAALATPVGGHHPLIDIATVARGLGLSLIPATQLAAPAPYQAAVQALVAHDKRGVLLRVDLQEFTSAAAWAPGWYVPLSDTDLLVDFADNVGTVAALGAALHPAFTGLHGRGQWRTVAISGTSMPENFTGFAAGQYTIRREEFALWQRLAGLGLPYALEYGDYATVPTAPPPSGIKWGFPINVKYTLAADFLVCRGVNTTGPAAKDMDVQLIQHAQTIVAYGSRGGLAHCWADGIIDQIAAKVVDPQGLEHWVQLGVNRHIELTRTLLP
jgi:Beta protein